MRCRCAVCAAHGDWAAVGVDVDAQGSSLREDETRRKLRANWKPPAKHMISLFRGLIIPSPAGSLAAQARCVSAAKEDSRRRVQ